MHECMDCMHVCMYIRMYSIFYLWTYKAPLTVRSNQRRSQCEEPQVVRERAETAVLPDKISARVTAGSSFHSNGPTEVCMYVCMYAYGWVFL